MASIRQKANGKWEARYYADGKLRGRTFATKRDAERFAAHERVKVDKGEWIDPAMQRVVFNEWIEIWWASKKAKDIRPSTTALYEYLLRRHIEPTFGKRRIAEITADEIDLWTAKLGRSGISKSTQSKAFRLLSDVMRLAVTRDRIAKSPLAKVNGPKEPTQEMRSLTAEEVKEVANAIDPHYRALVLLAAFTGLRWGEAVGLRPERIDLLHREIRIEEQLTEVNGHHAFSEPKTANGKRTVSIPSFLVPILDEQIKARSRNGLVFPGKDGGPIRRSNFTLRVWRPALRAAGVPSVRFHDLRHSAVRFAIANGHTAEQLTRWIGHSTIRTTVDRYGGWFPETREAIADGMDDLFNREPSDRASVRSIG